MNLKFLRFLIINFITSLIIAYSGCFVLTKLGLNDVLYIGNLFGIYFLIIYGLNILVEEGYIRNNYRRFLFAAIYILIFDIVFILTIPIIFNYNPFLPTDYLNFIIYNHEFNLMMNSIFYMVIFAIVIFIFNYFLYKSEMEFQQIQMPKKENK